MTLFGLLNHSVIHSVNHWIELHKGAMASYNSNHNKSMAADLWVNMTIRGHTHTHTPKFWVRIGYRNGNRNKIERKQMLKRKGRAMEAINEPKNYITFTHTQTHTCVDQKT